MGKTERVLACHKCSQTYKHRQHLHRHEQKCLNKVLYSFSLCSEVFSRQDSLKRCCLVCKNRQKTLCNSCTKTFLTPYTYRRHL